MSAIDRITATDRMTPADLMAERIERGRIIAERCAQDDGGWIDDADAWTYVAAAIADLLHFVDSCQIEETDAERVLSLAMLHYQDERAAVEPRCDVCNVLDVEAADWCGECGCCRAHCQQHEGCEVRA